MEFEKNMQRLSEIVARLEQGDLTLDCLLYTSDAADEL